MTNEVDGYIEFTITGRYPVVLSGYVVDPESEDGGRSAESLSEALSIDQEGVDQGVLTGYDFVDFADHNVQISLKVASDG